MSRFYHSETTVTMKQGPTVIITPHMVSCEIQREEIIVIILYRTPGGGGGEDSSEIFFYGPRVKHCSKLLYLTAGVDNTCLQYTPTVHANSYTHT